MFKKPVSTDDANTIIDILNQNHFCKENAAKTDVLLKNYKLGYTPRYLRMVVEFIRKSDLAAPAYLVSNTVNGYWLTKDIAEMKSFLNQELDRMSNQYGNIQPLHQRLISKKSNISVEQLHFFK